MQEIHNNKFQKGCLDGLSDKWILVSFLEYNIHVNELDRL